MQTPSKFNIRVYGIFINEEGNILLSDEKYNQLYFTKFPGGGLEFGEGIKDCLIREWKEEVGVDIEVGNHIYTTDFFIASKFNPTDQIICMYYWVKPLQKIDLPISSTPLVLDKDLLITDKQRFFPFAHFTDTEVTLPIDKVVANLLLQQ